MSRKDDIPYEEIGSLEEPEGFRYARVAGQGRPLHDRCSAFAVRHPRMEISRRAKIFSPFEALRGFGDAVDAKNEVYFPPPELCEDDCRELDEQLSRLAELVPNSRQAREHPVTVSVTFFQLCNDPDSEFCGTLGRYIVLTGTVSRVDVIFRKLVVGERVLEFKDIVTVEVSSVG